MSNGMWFWSWEWRVSIRLAYLKSLGLFPPLPGLLFLVVGVIQLSLHFTLVFTSNVTQVSRWFIASGTNKQSLAEKGQCVADVFGVKGTMHLKLGSKSLEIQLCIHGYRGRYHNACSIVSTQWMFSKMVAMNLISTVCIYIYIYTQSVYIHSDVYIYTSVP